MLLVGEIGTGKELLAHALHQLSKRSGRPMIKIDIGGISEHLIESELFGHEKGAFPGAFRQKKGRLELADGGTVFFNEIANVPLRLQEKLLRVLQEGKLERMGGNETFEINVRIVAATNRNLEELVAQGLMRKDLYYRLHILTIHNLPLRERREDIPLLAQYFVEKYSQKAGKQVASIAPKFLQQLINYPFPGNVRELENIIERAIILSDNKTLQFGNIILNNQNTAAAKFKSLEEAQRDHILEALKMTKGQITGENGAAKLLQLHDQTLYSKMKKLKIERMGYLEDSKE